ncbi:NAD(P)/FAD-dependent oxidoreductase [Streptomyces sp. NPDC096311]|uniref:NAD(P)/FAD-dependent oxidoreductase n=1 Tax=Streptomyces sp. NPDC096311 TaxID=3366083 RepID=UPI003812BA5C
MTTPRRVAVVGASAAGLAAVEGLRREGFDGRITLIGEERHLPYDRPPLSKQILSSSWDTDRLWLRPPEALAELDVDLRLGTRAVALDTRVGEIALADHDRVAYDSLVVATGVRARRLPNTADIGGVHYLRTLEDALSVRASLARRPHVVVVGGGFVGAEAAAVARELGCEVTIVTEQAVLLANALGTRTATMLTDVHREHGVRVETGALVEGVLDDGGRVSGVRLADGRVIAADAVLIGIGALPNIEWLAGCGVPLGNGVECNATLRAVDDIWAAGDVACWPDRVTGEWLRNEHRTNASEQGLAVALNILAGPDRAMPFTTVPYVWTDQYDLKIQVYGRTHGFDRMQIVDGSPADRSFTALYERDGHVCAAVGVNRVRALRGLRPLVAARADWDEASGSLTARAA